LDSLFVHGAFDAVLAEAFFLPGIHTIDVDSPLPEPTVNVEPEQAFGTEKDTAKEWTSRRLENKQMK
jgi:hypothetical protein